MNSCKTVNEFLNTVAYGKEAEEVCKQRTIYCLCWYEKKAVFYKFFFYTLSVLNIAAPLVSAVVATKAEDAFWMALISSLASLAASLLALFNVRDKWTTYRSAAEYIKSQYTLYCAKVSPYHDENAHARYLELIEKYMTDVHTHWRNTQDPENDEKDKENNGNNENNETASKDDKK